MPPRKRTRIAEGIYQDKSGLAATVKVGRLQKERRFPVTTPLDAIRSWRIQTRAELDLDRETIRAEVAGTLKFDGDRFLARKKGRIAYKADRAHMRAWYPTFGQVPRRKITAEDIELQIGRWLKADVAARTIRHRCRVLRECIRTLDGPKARTPVDFLKLPKPPAPAPAAVPQKTIRDVAAKLKAAGLEKDYARFAVRATTGQRPTQIMRTEPADIDLKRRIWFVRPAKGGQPIPMPLNREMLAAWKAFAKADAWGVWDTARAADVLRAHGWPAGVRPYDLRHTFAIDHLLAGTDLGDLQGLLGHTQIQTTRTYYAPMLIAKLRKVTTRRVIGLK